MDILVIGRFQPFHNGHLHVIKSVLKKANLFEDNLIKIAIGSIQSSFVKTNPFTFYERKEMISRVLKKNRINNFLIIGLEDKNSNSKWIKELIKKTGKFDICYTNNELVQKILSENKKEVSGIELLDREHLSSTNIRNIIASKRNVEKFLPKETLKVMKKVDGFRRIESIWENGNRRIFTIGHSNRKLNDFIHILQEYNIKRLVDIRSGQKSKNNPQFDSDNLRIKLKDNGIVYLSVKKLGGHRKQNKDSINDFWKNSSFRAFADYIATDEFKAGIDEVKESAKKGRTAVMCAEVLPWRCHRFLVSDFLITKKFSVTHIINHNQTLEHKLNENILFSDKNMYYKK
jgi:nicotinamide-nucleotide adenylyltransferase